MAAVRQQVDREHEQQLSAVRTESQQSHHTHLTQLENRLRQELKVLCHDFSLSVHHTFTYKII